MSQPLSTTKNPHLENPKNGMGYTPPGVSDFLHRTISLVLHPQRILDPSIGRGALTAPWSARNNAYIIGIDVDPASKDFADEFLCTKFEDVSVWNLPIPDLVLCNPPVNDAPKRGLYPEIFLQKMVELFGTKIPIVLFVPIYFRLGQRINSERRRWLLDKQMDITSIISLPMDIFPNVKFHSEILLFNIPGLKAHYLLDMDACRNTRTIQIPVLPDNA
jgi:hypothetical protein